jgi:hypothetical protein
MAELLDLKRAYLIGIRDGFRLARADTQLNAADLIAEIKSAMDVRLRDVRAEFDRLRALDSAGAAGHDPTTWLN